MPDDKNNFNEAEKGAGSGSAVFKLCCDHIAQISKILIDIQEDERDVCGISLLYDHLTDQVKGEHKRKNGHFIVTGTRIDDLIPGFKPWKGVESAEFKGSVRLCRFINANKEKIGFQVVGKKKDSPYECGSGAHAEIAPYPHPSPR